MYTAEVVSIGNEVLSGATVNTNAAFISKKLEEIGIKVSRQITIPDDEELIIEALSESLAMSPLVIATGGLGPTLDDKTCEAVAKLFDSPLELHEEIENALIQRFGPHSSLKSQATLPKKALILPNQIGTASGLVLNNGQSTLIVLPGVPMEMQALMEKEVIPYLLKTFSSLSLEEKTLLHFAEIYESQIDPTLRDLKNRFPALSLGIYPRNGLVTVSLKGDAREVLKAKEEITRLFDEHLYESDDGAIETAVHNLFIKRGLTLSLAESCTGGALAARLVSIPSASTYFLGSVVAYANALKENLLGVSPELIREKGAVSAEVAIAMVEGLEQKTGSDASLAITGIAGPLGGSAEKPIGTVFIARKQKNRPAEVKALKAHGSREMIIDRSVNAALAWLAKLS